jgi:hypothetical protein
MQVETHFPQGPAFSQQPFKPPRGKPRGMRPLSRFNPVPRHERRRTARLHWTPLHALRWVLSCRTGAVSQLFSS